jgi:hypothetical protein
MDLVHTVEGLEGYQTAATPFNNSVVGGNTTTTTTPDEDKTSYSSIHHDDSSYGRTAISSFSSNYNHPPPAVTPTIPLAELVLTDPNPACKPGGSHKTLIHSVILDESITHLAHRKIPKIIHLTSKTRCMTPYFIKNIQKWQFDDYSLYIHDDAAVDRLLQKYWPEFPHLQTLRRCMISGAAKADLWRYLVLWEYGGIYTDIDNAPGKKFENGTAIQDADDSWFVVERIGIMSQYFMAASPKHPFLYICVMRCLSRLMDVTEVGTQYVPYVTGPGVVKQAMTTFMRSLDNASAYNKVKKGKYVGVGNRSITIGGGRGASLAFVERESVKGIHKKGGFAAMGMTHFSRTKNKKLKISCFEHLYNNEEEKQKAA